MWLPVKMQKTSEQLRVGMCGLSACLLSNNRYRKCDYSRNQIFACMKTGLAIDSIAKTQSRGSRVRGFAGESWRRVPISLSWLMSHQSAGSHPSMAQMSAGSPRGRAVEADNVSHRSRLPGLIEPKRGGSGTDAARIHHSARRSADRSSGGWSSIGVAADILTHLTESNQCFVKKKQKTKTDLDFCWMFFCFVFCFI